MGRIVEILVVLTASCVAALAITPAVRMLAIQLGFVAKPAADRWHARPTAMLGGVAVALATGIGILVSTAFPGAGWGVRAERIVNQPALGVLVSASLMFVLGLVDDVLRLKPQLKFSVQALAGIALIAYELKARRVYVRA